MGKIKKSIILAYICITLCACQGTNQAGGQLTLATDDATAQTTNEAESDEMEGASDGATGDAMSEATADETVTAKTRDFTKDALLYLNEICVRFPDRNCLDADSDHDACRDWLVGEISNAGYATSQISFQNVTGEWEGATISGKNVVLTVEGANPDKQIVVGAHYDGNGAGDNASGMALMLAAIKGLRGTTPDVTVKYAFFDQEEIGRCGSEAFCDRMEQEEIDATALMINIDAIAFGDYCNIYGGVEDKWAQTIKQTEGYDRAVEVARALGFNVYDTAALDGYFETHGEGPAPDANGLFTNPWTFLHPAPSETLLDELNVHSPSTMPISDHRPFRDLGIPYLYLEATNWFVKGDDPTLEYSGYYETADATKGDGGMYMNTTYDTLENLNRDFPERAEEHFHIFSPLLSFMILHPEGDAR